MERSWWWKVFFLVGCVTFSALYVYPTFSSLDLEKTNYPIKQKINLGLDLQGGLYLVLGVDFNQVFKEVVERKGTDFEQRLKEKNIAAGQSKLIREGYPEDDPRFQISFPVDGREKLYRIFKDEYFSLRLTDEKPGLMEFGLSNSYRADVREKTINQSIEVIRNRIDEFGVSEPSISSQGNSRVVVELPGVKDIERAKSLIGRTAKLEFKMVDDKTMNSGQVAVLIANIEKKQNLTYNEEGKFSEYVAKLNEYAKSKIPENTEIVFEKKIGQKGEMISRSPYLIKSKTEVTGEELADAQVQFDSETRRPTVGFTLNPRGASLFEKLTGDHIGERLAIVLDGIVHSAPVIQSKIGGGRGQITLGSGNNNDLMKEAKDLAIVLRAGALPAKLELLEQRVVGPSLGHDSIQKGGMAGVIGAICVFIFMIFYYRVSGVIAVFSLILNILFVFAVLVALEATLTLPGIAGIALTVGIAVDSNVVIYERIREELRAGKSLGGSVDSGFQKALRTILDANVTNAAAAIVLLTYGTGPIKGFAVTMLIGIVSTLFTAVFVCRLLFGFYLSRLERKPNASLSI